MGLWLEKQKRFAKIYADRKICPCEIGEAVNPWHCSHGSRRCHEPAEVPWDLEGCLRRPQIREDKTTTLRGGIYSLLTLTTRRGTVMSSIPHSQDGQSGFGF